MLKQWPGAKHQWVKQWLAAALACAVKLVFCAVKAGGNRICEMLLVNKTTLWFHPLHPNEDKTKKNFWNKRLDDTFSMNCQILFRCEAAVWRLPGAFNCLISGVLKKKSLNPLLFYILWQWLYPIISAEPNPMSIVRNQIVIKSKVWLSQNKI